MNFENHKSSDFMKKKTKKNFSDLKKTKIINIINNH